MNHKLQRALTCLLALTLLICPTLAASSFPDVDESAEYAEAVEYLKDVGIMQGNDKGNFNPNHTVTRAEMAAIICRMLDETDNLIISETFIDVPSTHWANAYISRAAELEIVNGYGNGNFGPSDPVTYEQAIAMVVRAVGGEPEAQAAGGYPTGYLAAVQEYGLLEGITLKKGQPMVRADIAVLINNCVN